jgi:hypothetical protein
MRGGTVSWFEDPQLTIEEFNALLDKLRPHPERVEAIYQREGENIGVIIFTTIGGKRSTQYVLNPEPRNALEFEEEVSRIIEFYKNPPRLWPGCRGVLSRYLGIRMDKEFNRWFDAMVNAAKKGVQ